MSEQYQPTHTNAAIHLGEQAYFISYTHKANLTPAASVAIKDGRGFHIASIFAEDPDLLESLAESLVSAAADLRDDIIASLVVEP